MTGRGSAYGQTVDLLWGPLVWFNDGMTLRTFASVAKAKSGDRVAILSPAFAAPAVSEVVHEQAMRRLREATGLEPVEYSTTRQLGASAEARPADITAAFTDPIIRAVLATIGGDDQVTVIPHIDADILAANPKPFLGYSDNMNLHNLLWNRGAQLLRRLDSGASWTWPAP